MAESGKAPHKAVTNAVAAAGALTGLVVALTELRDKAAALLGVDERWIGVCGIILTLGFVWGFWIGPRVQRWWRAHNAELRAKPDGFRLHPYDSTDRAAFAREDKEHERILKWLRGAADPLLYLAGASGSGKSSLLHAFVLPELSEKDKHVCIAVRGVNEPLQQIRRGLLRPDAVWQNPKDGAEESTAALTRRAAAHLSRSEHRLYIIFDQFEELLILHERESPEVAGVLEFIKAVTDGEAGSVPTVLLVMRSDYEGRVRELGLPAERMVANKEVVRLVSEPQAEAFLERGGLRDAAIRKRLVHEAANLEETKGRLRFITLNFLGLAASEAPGRVRGGRTGRGLLRGAVRAWVTAPAVREHADSVLRPMISDEETKKPMTLAEIVRASGLQEPEVARVLMQLERDGLVRRHQNEKDIWEISHDFVARLLQRVLDDLSGSLLVRARPWLGAIAGAAVLLALAGVAGAMYVRYDRALLAWQISGGSVVDAQGPHGGKRVKFEQNRAVRDATLRYLAYLPARRDVTELDLTETSITDTGLRDLARPDTGLEALTVLNLRSSRVTDAGVRHLVRPDTGLKALNELDLRDTLVTDAGVKDIARPDTGLKALKVLEIEFNLWTDELLKFVARPDTGIKALTVLNLKATRVTDAGVKDLARPDSGLRALAELDLRDTTVTDAGVKDLARSDTGLKTLTSLYLGGTQVTDAGVKDLARSDTGLKALNGLNLWGTRVTDVGVKDLARPDSGLKTLTSLYLGGTQVTDAGVKDLARPDSGLKALTSLYLGGTKVTDAGVKDLARSDSGLKTLTSLYLGSTQVTDAGVKDLARSDTGLKALKVLEIKSNLWTDELLKCITRPDTGLKALTVLDLRDTQVTDAGVKDLARSDTGLKALKVLAIESNLWTDELLRCVARPDTGLRALTVLNLKATRVTDAGVKDLARPDTGLKALTELNLGGTQVTDAGVTDLARSDTGLKALNGLNLWGTRVTDAGLKDLARPDSGLKTLTSLYLGGTPVTDAGVKDLARSDTGLKALMELNISYTRVTEAGIMAVKARWPGITIIP